MVSDATGFMFLYKQGRKENDRCVINRLFQVTLAEQMKKKKSGFSVSASSPEDETDSPHESGLAGSNEKLPWALFPTCTREG